MNSAPTFWSFLFSIFVCINSFAFDPEVVVSQESQQGHEYTQVSWKAYLPQNEGQLETLVIEAQSLEAIQAIAKAKMAEIRSEQQGKPTEYEVRVLHLEKHEDTQGLDELARNLAQGDPIHRMDLSKEFGQSMGWEPMDKRTPFSMNWLAEVSDFKRRFTLIITRFTGNGGLSTVSALVDSWSTPYAAGIGLFIGFMSAQFQIFYNPIYHWDAKRRDISKSFEKGQ